MTIHRFTLNNESLKRKYSIYAVVANVDDEIKIYIGKTGDNRDGCNPIISRCGNHFSYNKIHSQIRNKFYNHELWTYRYLFVHFQDYEPKSKVKIDEINEMERLCRYSVGASTEIGVYLENKLAIKYKKGQHATQDNCRLIEELCDEIHKTVNEIKNLPNKSMHRST